MKTQRRAFLIIGAPRSGTSVVSHAVSLLGVDFGNPNHFVDTSIHKHNPIFFELDKLWRLNDSMLAHLGSCFGINNQYLPVESDFNDDFYARFKVEMTTFVQDEFRDSLTIGLKDPRFCFTVHAWNRVLSDMGFSVFCILTTRSTEEMVCSNLALHPNENYFQLVCDAIIQYLLSARYFTRDMQCLMIDYGKLIENPEEILTHIAGVLNLNQSNVKKAALICDKNYRHFLEGDIKGCDYLNKINRDYRNSLLDPVQYLHFREIYPCMIYPKNLSLLELLNEKTQVSKDRLQSQDVRRRINNFFSILKRFFPFI